MTFGEESRKSTLTLQRELIARFGDVLNLPIDEKGELFLDLVEVWEDFQRIYPKLVEIVSSNCSADEFRQFLSVVETWSWHTADHLNSIHHILSENEW